MPYKRIITTGISEQGRALAEIADNIAKLDANIKLHADAIIFAMHKKEGLMVCLKQLAKELK